MIGRRKDKEAIVTSKTKTIAASLGAAAALLLAAAAPAEDIQGPREPKPSEIMPLADDSLLLKIARADGRFVIVGERGHVLLSDDGRDWRQVRVPTRAMLNQVRFVDEEHGWAVGHDGSVIATRDGGESWTLQVFDSEWGRAFYDVHFFDREHGLVVGGNGRILATDDGGETWEDREPEVFAIGHNINDLAELADGTLVAAGERGLLARSEDRGQTWTMLQPPYIGSYFGALPYGEAGMVVHSLQGRAYLAEDVHTLPTQDHTTYDPFTATGVENPAALETMGWQRLDGPSDESLFGGHLLNDKTAVFVGVDGVLFYGDLERGVLEPLDSPTGQPLSGVLAHDGRLILVGRGGIYHASLPE